LALDPEAKRRWRQNRIGDVSLRSPRGIAAALLILVCVVVALANPVLVTVAWLQGHDTETQEVTLDVLVLNFVFNAIILVLLPVGGLALARPKNAPRSQVNALAPPQPIGAAAPAPETTAQAVVRRLGLGLTSRTYLWILIGAGAAVVALLVFGATIAGLIELGMDEPEVSPLIDDIDALLTWPLVFLIPLVAAVTEEIFFRGVLQPRVGVLASSLFFGIVHIGYGTWIQVVAPVFLGLLFGLLFLRTGSLWAAIAAHFTWDFIELIALKVTQ
jgi:membrane protease YdiL (CAAX protease family)